MKKNNLFSKVACLIFGAVMCLSGFLCYAIDIPYEVYNNSSFDERYRRFCELAKNDFLGEEFLNQELESEAKKCFSQTILGDKNFNLINKFIFGNAIAKRFQNPMSLLKNDAEHKFFFTLLGIYIGKIPEKFKHEICYKGDTTHIKVNYIERFFGHEKIGRFAFYINL